MLQAGANGADRILLAAQQLPVGRHGALRIAQARDEGFVIGSHESEHGLSVGTPSEPGNGFSSEAPGLVDAPADRGW
jgi:hypothetical protein